MNLKNEVIQNWIEILNSKFRIYFSSLAKNKEYCYISNIKRVIKNNPSKELINKLNLSKEYLNQSRENRRIR